MNSDAKSIMFITDGDPETDATMAALQKENYSVTCQPGSRDWLNCLPAMEADLLMVDTMRLSLDDLSAFARARAQYSGLFVVLAEKIHDTMQVMLYENGIDDVLVKPLNMLLMLARIRAMFRRSVQYNSSRLSFSNGLEINNAFRQATLDDNEIELTSREFDLLWYMARNVGTTLDRDQLYQAIFGIEYNGYDRSIDMYVSRLRRKLVTSTNDQMIKTVRGRGYLFTAQ